MKWKPFKMITSLFLVLIVSCDEPETTVTNYVHPDGSVTRKIEMRSSKENFSISEVQVPYDSTWTVKDSVEIDDKRDTTWVRRAEKLYKNTEEINRAYRADSGVNKGMSRRVEFAKKFRWFNTVYRFSEIVDKELEGAYLVGDFLNTEELKIFYSPDRVRAENLAGPDSILFKAIEDTISKKVDRWMMKCLVSAWIDEFTNLSKDKAGTEIMNEKLKKHEDEIVRLLETDEKKFDSLWINGVLIKELTGKYDEEKFKEEADSAITIVSDKLFGNFIEYSVKIKMPGKLTGSNGFPDSADVILWPVKSDFFLTDKYEMWAESKMINSWTWIISGLFLAFVIAGLIIREKKG